ncbi:zf-HC2 domain-containing protein [bacterium]|nr:zf-HC2 domain-containing protein [bacterium]
MNRHITEDERTALLMGLASLEEAERIRAHAAGCESCRRELAEDREIQNSLKELAIPSPSAERWDELFVVPPSGGKTHARHASPMTTLYLWAMRAALITLVFASGYWLGGSRQNASQPLIQPGWASTRAAAPVQLEPPRTVQCMLSMADDTTTERRDKTPR